MRSHALAVWLFERLDVDTALAGDLLEECARGRSAIWYWRQVLIAIWIGTWSTIFDHKLLALRAVATGCAVNGVWLFLWLRFLHLGLPAPPPDSKQLLIQSMACLSIILLTQTVTGWIVARTHRAHAIPMVVALVVWLVFWYIAGTVAGTEPRFLPHFVWYLTPISVEVAGLFLGGVIGGRPKRHRPQTVLQQDS